MKIFTQTLVSLLPAGITLPPELTMTFDWIEDQGWLKIRGDGRPEDHSLLIYPPAHQNHPVASHVAFGNTALPYTGHWSTSDPEVDSRIFEFGETCGDGGRVAIWLDDSGKQQFVHISHDSLGIISDDPLALLQFLAMGYPEPGHLPRTDITPVQAYLDYHGVESLDSFGPDKQPVFPTELQGFLKQRFGLEMPATAREIGIMDFPAYHAPETIDPFARWITDSTLEPTAKELAYEQELLRRVESLDLKDEDTSDTIMQKIGSLFQSKD